jgi:CheY-like chemotaxis protein
MDWRIVVVDDDTDVRALLSALFASEPGFVVVGEAADGRAAVELVRWAKPDVVLLDWHMPSLDGLNALPEIRRMVPDAVIVMLSGLFGTDVEASAIDAGADSFCAKTPDLARHLAYHVKNLLSAQARP